VSLGAAASSPRRASYPHLREDWLLIADRNFIIGKAGAPPRTPARALLCRMKSDLTLPPLELYPDGSYRSVLVNPKIRGK
jgi:hypothetical protein